MSMFYVHGVSCLLVVVGHVHRELPGSFESSNVSRGNVSRETGRMTIKMDARMRSIS